MNDIESAQSIPSNPVIVWDSNTVSSKDKIVLFRSLFRGREDVYARRFESYKTGKSGYQPACVNEWNKGLCQKPKIKCSNCPHRRFLAVTDEVVRWHLSGSDKYGRAFVMGMYPMLLDETCFFLAIDLDKDSWPKDCLAVFHSCQKFGLPAALERSRSGSGAHVWLFFEEAISAKLARSLGSALLTETMESRPDIGLRSYDRLFPNQDTLPKGGLGNLIALPLQKQPRSLGNSIFVDENLSPYQDQWALLASMRKVGKKQVELIVGEAEKRGRIVGVRCVQMIEEDNELPWGQPPSRQKAERPISCPLPETIQLVIEDQIYINHESLPPELRIRLIRLAAFQNPDFYHAQAMRLPVYSKPRVIDCSEVHGKYIGLPRGCLDSVLETLQKLHIKPVLKDERFIGKPFDAKFCGELKPEQIAAAKALLEHDMGVLSATTAFGKTVIAAWLIAQRKVNTLVLVHREQLLDQWIERLSMFLGLPMKEIGRIGAGSKKPTGILDVAIIQSLVRKEIVNDLVAAYGQVVVDECHHLSARSFELAARRAKAKYFTGLSATVVRKDGHHPIIFMQCGPLRYRVNAKQQAALRPFAHKVLVRPTGFRIPDPANANQQIEFHELFKALTTDSVRNQLICDDVVQTVREGRSPLILTERTEHLVDLAGRLAPLVSQVIILQGGMGKREQREAAQNLAKNSDSGGRILLATGKYIGEGFDDPRLDTLFLTLPVSWRGIVAQYVGRLHRLLEGKREVRVYDYADLNVPVFAKMFDRRCRGYEAVGYTILLPASAVPGWPVEVPLPIDPEWKKDYAVSVQRLVIDGVDIPLAHLFVHATNKPSPDSEGEDRARSASEAFLFRRLETLPQTRGRFQLNKYLPIPFGGEGKMEVDLFCENTRTVIEIDGNQHLMDADAYRRDRRKDTLLQENGYFILRFLAEDVGKRLDDVLDSILRIMSRSSRSH